jgi:hypothetical protein
MTNPRGIYRQAAEYTAPKTTWVAYSACYDCRMAVHPTMSERGRIRCSLCRTAHIESVIGARRAAAE